MISKLRDSPYTMKDIRNASDLIEKCSKWVPKERITAAEALKHPFFNAE